MELGLGRQPPALPAGVGRRLRVADVDGPGRRQRDEVSNIPRQNHASAVRSQKSGCRDVALASRQRQPSSSQSVFALVAARLDELEEVAVGDVVDVDLEGRDLDACSANSLSQPNGISSRFAPSVARPAGTRTVRARGRLAAEPSGRGMPAGARLLLVRKAVPHVEQRLLVHRLVLEHRVARRGPRASTGLSSRVTSFVASASRIGAVGALARRPDRDSRDGHAAGAPGDRRLVLGIDAALEEDLEPRIDPRLAEPPLDERVDREGRQVPLVEHDICR